MKKLITIFFLSIYSFTTVGINVHAHYCMGEYIGSNLYHTSKEECGKCGMKTGKLKDCCQYKHQYFQLKREHSQTITSIEIPKLFIEALIPDFKEFAFSPVFNEQKIISIYHSPPVVNKHRLHLLNCVFLI